MDQDHLRRIIEALIFASDQPISAAILKRVIESVSDKEIEQAVTDLNAGYEETDHSFEIVKVGGGYRYKTRPQFAPYIRKLFRGRRKPKLSRAGLETLSIIAYRQPIHRSAVEAIRGVNVDGVLNTLLERGLITITGRAKAAGRPLLYGTTPEFLHYFGINDLSDLPELREIEDLLNTSKLEGMEHEDGMDEHDSTEAVNALSQSEEPVTSSDPSLPSLSDESSRDISRTRDNAANDPSVTQTSPAAGAEPAEMKSGNEAQ